MEQEEVKREEEKVINKTELAELTRLNTERERALTQSDRMKYKEIARDVVDKAKKDALDYIQALGKKYDFNPFLYGINRSTGVITKLPDKSTGKKKKGKK